MNDVIWFTIGVLGFYGSYLIWERRRRNRAAYELHQAEIELEVMKYYYHLANMINVGERSYTERAVELKSLIERIRGTDRLEHYSSLQEMVAILESTYATYLEIVDSEIKLQEYTHASSRLLDLSTQLSKIGESESPDHGEINRLYDEVLKITSKRSSGA